MEETPSTFEHTPQQPLASPNHVKRRWLTVGIAVAIGVILLLSIYFVTHTNTHPSHGSNAVSQTTADTTVTETTPPAKFQPTTFEKIGTITNISGVADQVGMGFNNAEQVIPASDGGSFTVWTTSSELLVGKRDQIGNVTSSIRLAQGSLNLPAITGENNLIAVAWTDKVKQSEIIETSISTDGGKTFSPPTSLGAGTGVSLANVSGNVYAVWHEGSEKTSSRIMFRALKNGIWSSAIRIDTSTAAPVWASIGARDSQLYVVWRDNREGDYSIWMRRSVDAGQTWLAEQHLVSSTSGDPDVCVTSAGVLVAHHGKSSISLLKSVDQGATFSPGQIIGDGWFAHLNCTEEVSAVIWENTKLPAIAKGKKVGWYLIDATGKKLGAEVIDDGENAAPNGFLAADHTFEVLWIKVDSQPLTGAMRHQLYQLK